ncbi:MAG: manganese efflux pump [Lachnospiraceae bacterium]|nr:manganese efflux pump [Lachnospiraceae bacterium]
MGLIMLLAVSVSLDTLGIGMAYAVSGIRIPWSTRLIIAFMNGILTLFAVAAGERLVDFVPDELFRIGGAAILIFLGSRTLWNALGENKTADYDRDASHVLEPWEGMVLGLTLALDSISAGFGITGYGRTAYVFPFLTALAGGVFLTLGTRVFCNLRRINGIGGGILIILGFLRFFCSGS